MDRATPPASSRLARGRAFEFLIGVDGGGSKTVAIVADRHGRVRGRGEGGTSNHYVAGWRGAFAAVTEAIRDARRAAACPAGPALAVCLGMAGADTVLDHDRTAQWLKRQRIGQESLVVNDGTLLLAATRQEEGVAVVSGTGSIAWGKDAQGNQARSGGWGHLIGDEGSGYSLSIEALRHTVTAADGRAAFGGLARAVLRFYGVKEAQGLLPFVYGTHIAKADVAKLAPLVFRLAARGDLVAQTLVDAAAAALASLVLSVTTELGIARPALALGGSLLVRQKALRDGLLAKLTVRPSTIAVVRDPAIGAVYLARRLAEPKL